MTERKRYSQGLRQKQLKVVVFRGISSIVCLTWPGGIHRTHPMLPNLISSSGYDPRKQFHFNDVVVLSLQLVLSWFYGMGTRLAIRNCWKCHEIQPVQPVETHIH